VRDGPVLLGLLGQHPLDAEGLLRRHFAKLSQRPRHVGRGPQPMCSVCYVLRQNGSWRLATLQPVEFEAGAVAKFKCPASIDCFLDKQGPFSCFTSVVMAEHDVACGCCPVLLRVCDSLSMPLCQARLLLALSLM
jgi:hypothetical protein